MAVTYQSFVQPAWRNRSQWRKVKLVSLELREHLETRASVAAIAKANRPGRSSADIQKTLGARAKELGFESEKKGMFAADKFQLKPDYYLPIDDTGILLEVERGKTTINNMDLLDFWKCHLCRHANYLFLLVPSALRQNDTMSPVNEFAKVRRRLATFFECGNETNVRGMCLFGY